MATAERQQRDFLFKRVSEIERRVFGGVEKKNDNLLKKGNYLNLDIVLPGQMHMKCFHSDFSTYVENQIQLNQTTVQFHLKKDKVYFHF